MNNTSGTKVWVERELERCKSLHYKFVRRLGRLPAKQDEGSLTYLENRGVRYYSVAWKHKGKRSRHYYGAEDHPEIRIRKERRFLEKAIAMLKARIAMLESMAPVLERFDCREFNATLPKAYQLSDGLLREIAGPDEEEDWYRYAVREKKELDDQYGINNPSRLIHRASDGTMMRSKSEVTIANELIKRGIPYIYEMPIFLNNMLFHPDFCFYSYSRGKVMFWEHVGMLNDENYQEIFKFKIDQYIFNGYIPCVDIIFTFDTSWGSIDTQQINAVIDEYR